MRTNKCNEILYLELSIAQHGSHAEPPRLFEHFDELHSIFHTSANPLAGLVVLAVVRALSVRVYVNL